MKGLLRQIDRDVVRLEHQRDELDRAIARLRLMAAALRRDRQRSVRAPQSLTNACRVALRSRPAGLAPREVKQLLSDHGFAWDDFTNPMSAVHTVLKRLVKQNEASARIGADGRRRFLWKHLRPLAIARTQAEQAARIEHLLDGSLSSGEYADLLDRWRSARDRRGDQKPRTLETP